MGITFNADEVLEMAMEIERNGARFYRKAAGLFRDAAGKKVMLDLAAMEDHHLELFEGMRKGLGEEAARPEVYDPEGEGSMYLRAMADARVFDTSTDPSKLLTGKESRDDVLRMAIGLEKDSVLFYLGLRELVPPRFGGYTIDEIIKEEMRHISLLTGQLTPSK